MEVANWDDLVRECVLSAESILSRVDEYDLYCHYLGFTPDFYAYRSPIRESEDRDDVPSWCFFPSNIEGREYWWKDMARRVSGDIFRLVQLMFGLESYGAALQKIDVDFNLGFGSNVPIENKLPIRYAKPTPRELVKIRVETRDWEQRDLDFWMTFGISLSTLTVYDVLPVKYYFLIESQEAPIAPRDLCYRYRIDCRYKLYQPTLPKELKLKFRTDFLPTYVEGLLQVCNRHPNIMEVENGGDVLIITKATKECMWFWEHLSLDGIAGKSETTDIPEHIMLIILRYFKYVFILQDSDRAGYEATAAYVAKYPELIPIYIEENLEEKDPTDLHKRYGQSFAIEYVLYLINNAFYERGINKSIRQPSRR